MGVAAYYRGNRAISAQFCMESGCHGCVNCSTYTPTPRPAGWGDKARAKADKRAASLVRYFARDGRTLSVDDLADMVREGVGCGAKTARQAAIRATEAQP